jgi:hypothetical protein
MPPTPMLPADETLEASLIVEASMTSPNMQHLCTTRPETDYCATHPGVSFAGSIFGKLEPNVKSSVTGTLSGSGTRERPLRAALDNLGLDKLELENLGGSAFSSAAQGISAPLPHIPVIVPMPSWMGPISI